MPDYSTMRLPDLLAHVAEVEAENARLLEKNREMADEIRRLQTLLSQEHGPCNRCQCRVCDAIIGDRTPNDLLREAGETMGRKRQPGQAQPKPPGGWS